MIAAKYLKLGLYTMATFLMWLLLGSVLSMTAPLLGIPSARIYEIVVNSTSSLTFLIALAVFYIHRRVFRRDIFAVSDTGHLMVVASTVFLPIFIYISCVSLIEQLIRTRFVSLGMLGDTLRHNFMVVVPVYFVTLAAVGIVFAGLNLTLKKFLEARRK